ncbi:hypothetical protein ACFE04_016523 [Oxalis oulophora]
MGFPVGYPDVFLPKVLVHALTVMGFIRSFIISLFTYLGLSDFIETDTIWPDYNNPTRISESQSISAALIREILPVVKLEDLVNVPESCVVCLCEFESGQEIRLLSNCKHVFHRTCLDRWIGHDQKTCPLCRTHLVPDEMQDDFNQRLLSADTTELIIATTDLNYEEEYGSIRDW